MTPAARNVRSAAPQLAGLLGAAWLLSLATPVDADPQDGKTMVTALCTQCHGLQPIASVRNGAEGWRTTVYKMVQNGSQIRSQTELETIVNYLADTYGPAAGAMVTGALPPGAAFGTGEGSSSNSITLPPGKGADLVKAQCTLCHDLGRIAATRRSAGDWQRYTRVMLARGSLSPGRAATDSIAAYLTEHFGAPRAD